MAEHSADEVERLESWQLAGHLARLERQGLAEVTWNRERITLEEAKRRSAGVSPTATVVVDGAAIYVAEPDHSADDRPAIRPIQLGSRHRPS